MHPYKQQPDKAFWQRTVSGVYPLDITSWYKKKFDISNRAIATAGSCFAQHIGRNLRRRGFDYIDTEPAPRFLRPERHLDYGYSMYSARYGNVYTTRQLLQLLQRALGEFKPEEVHWAKDNGVVDPFRPTIEPQPFSSIDEMLHSRKQHLEAVIRLFEKADVFVFTLGLTEAWVSLADGAAFPVAPGVSGGDYDDTKYRFLNMSFTETLTDLRDFMNRVRSINNKMRFLLTVSPVPLMATATNQNVVVATSYSKSVLRAVAGQLAESRPYVDYFPSYEIIGSHIMRGSFYNPDMRTVSEVGVNHVMSHFFKEHRPSNARKTVRQVVRNEDVACDEELLANFGDAQ